MPRDDVADELGPWKTSWVSCRMCDHVHVAVYPVAVVDECMLQCPRCEHQTCEPCDAPDEAAR